MTNDERHDRWSRIRDVYNVPPETPREEMWAAVSARIGAPDGTEERGGQGAAEADGPRGRVDVHDLADARRRLKDGGLRAPTALRRAAGWAAAAAAVLVLGVGIGRMSAPVPVATGPAAGGSSGGVAGVALAAREHLGRTESLLTMVRADARDGRIDPAVAEWAEALLAQTRLLLDRPDGVDPEVRGLLMDLELVLVQVMGAARTGPAGDSSRARTEAELTLRSLDAGEVLPRIQAALPDEMSGA